MADHTVSVYFLSYRCDIDLVPKRNPWKLTGEWGDARPVVYIRWSMHVPNPHNMELLIQNLIFIDWSLIFRHPPSPRIHIEIKHQSQRVFWIYVSVMLLTDPLPYIVQIYLVPSIHRSSFKSMIKQVPLFNLHLIREIDLHYTWKVNAGTDINMRNPPDNCDDGNPSRIVVIEVCRGCFGLWKQGAQNDFLAFGEYLTPEYLCSALNRSVILCIYVFTRYILYVSSCAISMRADWKDEKGSSS